MNGWRAVILLLPTLTSVIATASDLRPFVSGSAAQIRTHHAGTPYILALWSLNCAHCADELKVFGQLIKEHPELRLVLVSTDTPDEHAALTARLRQHGLEGTENWVFADDFSERLRHEIDPRWQGELPRSYLVAQDGTTLIVSGKLDRGKLRHWLKFQNSQYRSRNKRDW